MRDRLPVERDLVQLAIYNKLEQDLRVIPRQSGPHRRVAVKFEVKQIEIVDEES